jgi:flagellar basal body-associated protein FliL
MGNNNTGMMFLMLLALVAVVGMFVWFMSNNSRPNTIEVKPPQVSIPAPAKPDVQ